MVWGTISACTGAVQSYSALLGIRVLLGKPLTPQARCEADVKVQVKLSSSPVSSTSFLPGTPRKSLERDTPDCLLANNSEMVSVGLSPPVFCEWTVPQGSEVGDGFLSC